MKVSFSKLNNTPVLLAVSGGVDSMVMLDLFIKRYKGDFRVASISHGIRSQSMQDCLFVQQYCQERSIECEIIEADVLGYAQQRHLSIETSARLLRRAALQRCAEGRVICLAHNACDQAESVIMHLLRGSGNRGGSGMREYDDKIFRPLLHCTRQEIEEYAQEHNIPHVYDQTNSDTAYKRNYLRHTVLPLLGALNTNYITNLCAFADKCAQDEEIFDNIIEVAYAKTMPILEEDYAEIDLSLLLLHPSVSARIVLDIFQRIGYYYDIEQKHIRDIIALAKKQTGRQINLPFGLCARRNYSSVSISKILPKKDKCTEQVPFKTGKTVYNGQTVVVDTSPEGLMFALDRVPSDACWRTRREGDVIVKFGGGSKKLKDFLIDKKIDATLRDHLILLATGNKILAILDYCISEDLRVSQDSQIYYMKRVE